MGAKKMEWVLLVILATAAWVLGSAIQAGADTLKYKMYNYTIKEQGIPVGDEEGHFLGSFERAGFCVFENGEVARNHVIGTAEAVKGGVSTFYYQIITFSDGSTIVSRIEGTLGGGVPGAPATGGTKQEIIKGTGRFEGIKGTGSSKVKFFPLEKWEPGAAGVGEGAFEYTLPAK